MASLSCGLAVLIVPKHSMSFACPDALLFFRSYAYLCLFWPRNHEIKFILLSILDLRFLAFFLRGVAVFAEISRGFAVSGTPLTPPP